MHNAWSAEGCKPADAAGCPIRSLDARERTRLAKESVSWIRDQEPVCPD